MDVAVEILKERWTNRINEVTIGATAEQGGTRKTTVTIGGESCLPFLHFEGEMPNRPAVALEVWDCAPDNWPAPLLEAWKDVINDPGEWARKCVEEYGADLICLRLQSGDPEGLNSDPASIEPVVRKVLSSVGVPLMIIGCGDYEKDNQLIQKASEVARGENCLIGIAEEDNYKSIAAASLVNGHSVIAKSPIDINICKQLNILINEIGVKLDRIVIDPTTGGLGYGVEYTYSIMERARLGGLQGDKMLAMPMLNFVGEEAWRAKEAKETEEAYPEWGAQDERAILWELLTAVSLLQAGSDLVVMRHPEAAVRIRKHIDVLMQK